MRTEVIMTVLFQCDRKASCVLDLLSCRHSRDSGGAKESMVTLFLLGSRVQWKVPAEDWNKRRDHREGGQPGKKGLEMLGGVKH